MARDVVAEAALVDSYFRDKRSTAYKALNFLQFLVNKKVEGQFAAPGQPRTDAQIALQFYKDWKLEKHTDNKAKQLSYDDIRDAANALRRQVRDLLLEYYRANPDRDLRLDITDERDRFEPFLRPLHSERLGANAADDQAKGISISREWKNDRVHELLRAVVAETAIRLHITGFVDPRPMRATLRRALKRGAHIHILQADPDGPLIEARFRLRPELTVAKFRQEMRQQRNLLRALGEEGLGGSLEIRECDLMPFGHFIQGVSTDVGPWIIIGLLPPLAPYYDGPMIELRPAATELWNLFEGNWVQCWDRPVKRHRPNA